MSSHIHKLVRSNQTLYKIAKTVLKLRPQPKEFEVNIETTTYCNLSCPFCNHEELIKSGKRPLKMMTQETLAQALDFIEAYPFPKDRRLKINLTGLGEPLLHPEWSGIQAVIRKRFPTVPLVFATNGILLDADAFKRIMDNQIDLFCISLRFPDRERYALETKADCYDVVADNMRSLFQTRPDTKPIIHICLFEQEDFPKAQKEWLPTFKGKDRIYVIKRLDFSQLAADRKTPVAHTHKCIQPYGCLNIDVEGFVFPCCKAFWMRRNSELLLGHISFPEQVRENALKFQRNQPRLDVCKYCPR